VTALPTGWAVAPLTDIITIYDSKRIPLNKAHRAAMPGSIPYYGANGLVDHVRDYIFDGDYVLLAEGGGYFDEPARGVAYEVLGRFWVNNHAHILKPADGIQTRFLRHLLNATDWMPYVSGTTRLKLPQAGMQRAMVWVPPLAEQRRIVAKVDGLFASSYRARHELD
jgi:type I restriction enzyme S subunit